MKIYIYLLIFTFVISCSANKGVYWCGDHACANNKEKEAYFKKTMIVEVKNIDKNNKDKVSMNEKILNQDRTIKKKTIISEKKLEEKINIEKQIEIQEKDMAIKEKELEKQIEIQEKKIAKKEKKLEREINVSKKKKLNSKKESSPTFVKVIENNDIKSENFDELVEKILIRNSTRSYPKINDIPK